VGIGTTNVVITITDASGNTTTCQATFIVTDVTPPIISCPPDISTCESSPASLGTPVTYDNCGIASIVNNAPAIFPTGTTIVTWIVTDLGGNSATCQQSVSINPQATADAGPDEVICQGVSSFQVTGANASNYASLLWTSSGNGTLLNVNTLTPTYIPQIGETGNIYLTLTAYGILPCSDATDQMLLTIIPAPNAYAGSDDTICAGETFIPVTAYASNYNTILWTSSGSGSFSNPSILYPVYYPSDGDLLAGSVILTLTAYSPPTCNSQSDNMLLRLESVAIATAGPDASTCQGVPFTITGASALNYSGINWTHDGQGTLTNAGTLFPTYTPQSDETGIVTLTLTATGTQLCGDSIDSMKLVINGIPAISAGPDLASCDLSPVGIQGATAINVDSVTWSSTGTGYFNDPTLLHPIYSPGPEDLTSGSVILMLHAHALESCDDIIDGMMLTLYPFPTAFAGPDSVTCSNTPFLLSGSQATGAAQILWSHDGEGILSGDQSLHPTYTPAEGESGTVILTMKVNGFAPCGEVIDEMTLQVIPAVIANAGPDLNTCELSPVNLSIASASNYSGIEWVSTGTGVFSNTHDVNPYYTPSQADALTGAVILIMHATGTSPCVAVADSLILTITPGPTAYAGQDQVLCQGTSFTINDATATNYSAIIWTHNGNGVLMNSTGLNPTYIPAANESGSIVLTLTVQGMLSCSNMTASNEAVLSISQPLVVNAGTDQVIPPGTSTILTGIVDGGSGFYSYSWEPANLLQDPQLSITPTTELTESVTFTLTVIDISTGCTANDQVGIIMGNPNLPPVANADYDTASILNPAYIIILNNDMDPDGTIDSVTILLQPSHGTATLNPDKTITYIPTGGFEGVDTLIYLICDNGMPVLCDTALVTIRVFGTRPFDDIIIYNYLTPNGDNYNDTWIIDNIQFWPENVILLYNRWGDRIRAFEHYDNTTVYWDGTNDEGEHVPDGTYYYIVRVRHIDSMSGTMREDAKTGFVMVRANRK
jgi:gliding motility-associated-like protein